MCHPVKRVKGMMNSVQGRSLNQLYPAQFMENIPYNRAQVGKCLLCGRPMAKQEMKPANRATPRATCEPCYAQWAADLNVTETCIVCGDYLEDGRFNSFKHNPRELSNRIHDGRCMDYFALPSTKALGHDMSFLPDEHLSQLYDVVDAEFEEYRVPELPAPRQQTTVDEYLGNPRNRVPIPVQGRVIH